jgi:hypothetical protein
MATEAYILSVISRLQEAGKLNKERKGNWKNAVFDCPFHWNHGGRKVQNTPSFGILRSTGAFNCFNESCNGRGPSIDVLYERLMGIKDHVVEAEVSSNKEKVESLRDKILFAGIKKDLEPKALAYPTVESIDKHKDALEYLEKRNIPEWVWRRAGATFSPKHKRIVLPISLSNKIVGYSGRSILPNVQPKYYRPIENIGSVLYDPAGILNMAKKPSRVFIVEGEFDALSCMREWLPPLASFHSHLSKEAFVHLSGFQEVVFMYDPDASGVAGMVKAVKKFGLFLNWRIFNLPQKMDPGNMPVGYGKVILKKLDEAPVKSNLNSLRRRLNGFS